MFIYVCMYVVEGKRVRGGEIVCEYVSNQSSCNYPVEKYILKTSVKIIAFELSGLQKRKKMIFLVRFVSYSLKFVIQ